MSVTGELRRSWPLMQPAERRRFVLRAFVASTSNGVGLAGGAFMLGRLQSGRYGLEGLSLAVFLGVIGAGILLGVFLFVRDPALPWTGRERRVSRR